MRPPRAAAAAVLTAALAVLMTLGGPAAQADPPVPTTMTLARQPPAHPAVYHDRIDNGPASLPGVDHIEYQASLTSSGLPVAGQQVVLQRRLAGASDWKDVAAATTDQNGNAMFSTPVKGNATYQATYAGDLLLASATSGSVTLAAMRDFNAHIVQRSGKLYLEGNINPGWGRRRVSWQARTCRTCHWRTLTTARTSRSGAWRFRGGWAKDGRRVWFRAKLDRTNDFVTSTSSMMETSR